MNLENIYELFLEKHEKDYDLDFAKEKKEEFYSFIESLDLDKVQKQKLIDIVVGVLANYEQQGFYYGFAAGLNIQKESDKLS